MRHYALTRFSSLPPISHQALRGVELRTPDFKYPPGQWAERKRAPPVPVIKVLKLEVLDYQVRAGAAFLTLFRTQITQMQGLKYVAR